MWDVLIMIGNLVIIPAIAAMVLNPDTRVPRTTSGISVVGLALIMAGLLGAGLLLSTAVLSVTLVGWVFLFLFRGTPNVRDAATE
jgi:hypothetical protein